MLSVLAILTNPCVGFLKRCRVFCLSADKSNQNIRNFPLKKSKKRHHLPLLPCRMPQSRKKAASVCETDTAFSKIHPHGSCNENAENKGMERLSLPRGGRMIRPKPFGTPKVSWRHISGNTFPTGFDWGNAVPRQFP